jgi:hypothetical protein
MLLIMSLCLSGTSSVPPDGMLMSSDLNDSMKKCGMESRSLSGTAMPPLHYFRCAIKQDRRPTIVPRSERFILPFRADRENFLSAQDELKKRAIPFDFQDHEISHSIYFRDLDGHEIEITTYEL